MTPLKQREDILCLLDDAQKSGARLVPACKIIGISKRTIQHWREHDAADPDQRTLTHNSPAHKLTDAEREHLLVVANSPEYGHLPPSQFVPRLADIGKYFASESTFYRVLRAANQVQHRRLERPGQVRIKPRHISVFAPNQCYSWDITYLPTAVHGQYFYLYMYIDIFSRKAVGWQVHAEERSEHASALLKELYAREGIVPQQLHLHSDNGAPMKGSSLLATLQALGVASTRSRPSCSNDNPYSESLFKTLKYRPDMPVEPFADLEQARAWVEILVRWYNEEHRHSGISFVTPAQRHEGADCEILSNRHALYQAAKQKNPARWSRQTRNWSRINIVDLNPNKAKEP